MRSRIIKISVVAVLVLGLVVYNFYDYWLESRLHYQLSEIINKNPNTLYTYSFSELDIHIMDGSIDLEGITIKPTQAAVDSLLSEDNGLRFLLDLRMEQIELDGFDIKGFLATGNIKVDSLIISEPSFEYYFHPRKEKANQVMPLHQIFNEKFKEADLGKFVIRNGNIKIDDQSEEGAAINIHHLNIEMKGAHMDQQTLQRFSPFEYQDIQVMASGINVDASEDFTIISDTLMFDVDRGNMDILNFQLQPKHSQEKFSNLYDYQKQWMAIKLDHLIIRRIEMEKFLQTGLIDIGMVELNNPSLALYKDKTKPLGEKKDKKLPVSMIQSINWILNVDSVEVRNGFITVDQKSEKTGMESHLFFSDLNARVLNFTNSKSDESSVLYLDANASVLGKTTANLHMRFDLRSTNDAFTAWGDVGEVEGEAFNVILDPMIGMKVKDGVVHKVSFEFDGDHQRSSGIVDAAYEGIKIEFMKEDSLGEETKKGFMSFAANSVINSYNRPEESSYRQGIINYSRDPKKGIFSFLWNSIQEGLISIMAPFTNDKETKQQQRNLRKERKKKLKEKG